MAGASWIIDAPKLRLWAAQGVDPDTIAARLGRTFDALRLYARSNDIALPPRLPIEERAAAKAHAQQEPVEETPAAPQPDRIEQEFSGDAGHLRSRSPRIQTPEQLLDKAQVDRTVWEIERFVVNQWEMGAKTEEGAIVVEPLYQVKVWLKRNRKACVLKEIGERILADIATARPAWLDIPPAVVRSLKDRHLWEFCKMDLHVGKLAWEPEAGADYDVDIAERISTEATEDLIAQIAHRDIEQILVPIGNDLLQIDNLQSTTTGGTPQDTDTRFAKMFARAESIVRYDLERLSRIAPVVGVIVPGNHDRQSSFTLGRVLNAWFHGNPRVQIDVSPKLRKYHRYGVNLIGYTHGSEEKHADLPLIMAQERPQDWAETRFREFHVGHYHKAKETRYTAGDSFNGVRVRILSSLCASDAWHVMKGYVGGVRSAEALLWNHRTGYAGHQQHNVLEAA